MDTDITLDSLELDSVKDLINQNQYEQARKVLQHLISEDPLRPEAYNLLGIIFELEHETQKAQSMYRIALAVSPSYSPAIANLDRSTQLKYSVEGMNLG